MAHDQEAPSAWIERYASLVRPNGHALDLACGAGRHVRLLLAAGHAVTAVERDLTGVADLPPDGLTRLEADLEDGSPWPLPGATFDAVVVTNYLWRPLFPRIREAVAPGGVVLYETFGAGNEAFGRPRNPDFLLRPGELLEEFAAGFQVVAYEHGQTDRPAVVQRLCALRLPVATPPRLP